MDLAQNDPAELQNQIVEMSKQFATLNEKGQFEILPGAKRQMEEVEKAMGMTQGTLAKMALSSAELNDKMSKIRFTGNFTEEEKTMIANMSEMGKDGEYKITMMTDEGSKTLSMEEAMMKMSAMNDEQKQAFFESQKPKDIIELAKDHLSVSKSMDKSLETIANKPGYALAGSKAASKVLKKTKEGTQKLSNIFDDKKAGTTTTQLREQIDITTKGLLDSFDSGNINMEKLSKTFTDLGKYIDTSFVGTLEKAKTELSGFFDFSNDKSDGKKGEPDTTHVVTGDMVKMPGKNVELLPQDSIFAMTKGPEFLEKINMLNQPMNSQTNGVVNENKNTHNITLTIKIDSGNMSETKVMEILNKTETLQALNKKLKETVTNNGLTV
jgi:hypothetical protein